MIGKDYFARQAATLLKIAKITRDPTTVVAATTKAADMKSRLDEVPPLPVEPAQPPEISKQ